MLVFTFVGEHIWKLKESNADFIITWETLEKAQPYSPTTGKFYATYAQRRRPILPTGALLSTNAEICSQPVHIEENSNVIAKPEIRTTKLTATVHQDLPGRTAVK